MANTSIGIKIADGTFYPVLAEGSPGRKRVILTTVADNQAGAQIDLYRGNGTGISSATYIGTLVIEDIEPAPKGDPEIELIVKIDTHGNLDAQASDHVTGDHQTLTVSLATLAAGQRADFDLDEHYQHGLGVSPAEASRLTAQGVGASASDFREVEEDDRRLQRRRRRRNVGIAVLIVAIIAIIVLLVIWFSRRPASPPPTASSPQSSQSTQAPAPQPAQPPAPSTNTSKASPPPPPVSSSTSRAREGGVEYQIRWGDTLWDLSISFYRTPWLYGKIAKANNIKNPNLIYAQTQIYIPAR